MWTNNVANIDTRVPGPRGGYPSKAIIMQRGYHTSNCTMNFARSRS